MKRLVVNSRIDSDGMLRVAVPMEFANADQNVQVTIEPTKCTQMTAEQWRDWIRKTAGSITDPTFQRHDQGVFEVRDEIP